MVPFYAECITNSCSVMIACYLEGGILQDWMHTDLYFLNVFAVGN